jgi:hypothetical protein
MVKIDPARILEIESDANLAARAAQEADDRQGDHWSALAEARKELATIEDALEEAIAHDRMNERRWHLGADEPEGMVKISKGSESQRLRAAQQRARGKVESLQRAYEAAEDTAARAAAEARDTRELATRCRKFLEARARAGEIILPPQVPMRDSRSILANRPLGR